MNVDIPTFRRNIFQEMRGNLDQKFSELTSLLNQRKIDLFQKINDLEIEYNNKIKQFEKDKQTLIELREHTEQKLGQNSLFDVQTDIVSGINKNIENLEKESKLDLDLVLTLNWGFNSLKFLISLIDLELAPKSKFQSTGDETKSSFPKLSKPVSISPLPRNTAPTLTTQRTRPSSSSFASLSGNTVLFTLQAPKLTAPVSFTKEFKKSTRNVRTIIKSNENQLRLKTTTDTT